jgi:hypothetical protein
MTIGTTATVSGLNGSLTGLALQMRNLAQQIMNLQQYVVAEGTAGLETLGFDSADATNYMTMLSYLDTIAQVFYGTATQPSEYNFANAVCGLWAGQ